eukprot:1090213-Pyramimonas_sp.AAC.1
MHIPVGASPVTLDGLAEGASEWQFAVRLDALAAALEAVAQKRRGADISVARRLRSERRRRAVVSRSLQEMSAEHGGALKRVEQVFN